jgi:hypothetical protein
MILCSKCHEETQAKKKKHPKGTEKAAAEMGLSWLR